MFNSEQANAVPSCSNKQVESETLQLALTFAKDLISRHTADGFFTYVSPSVKTLLDYTQEEIAGQTIFSLCHPDDKATVNQLFLYLWNSDRRVRFRIRKKEGDYIWVETSSSKVGSSQDFLLVSRDITTQMIMEDGILETQERYRLLVEHAKDSIGMMTDKGIWTYINSQGKKLFGFASAKEAIGTSLFDYIPFSDYPLLTNYLKEMRHMHFEMTIKRTDGGLKKAHISLIPMTFRNRKIFQVIIKDITSQKETEEKLLQAEKLSLIGQMAAAIAHEVRNPITSIKGFTQFLNEKDPNEYCQVILGELDRLDGIVNDLLVLAKPPLSNAVVSNLVRLTQNVLALLKPFTEIENITYKENYESSEILVQCEEDKMKQVLINVLKNAIEAMPSGGILSISISREGDVVRLTVEDEGTGIEKEDLAKIGEPFYSTKQNGTGLGLMVCKKIIEEHGGRIYIRNRETIGTAVSILLPLLAK
ncbi:PAS domain-containing sensor histidine kinase [Bacillus sp. FJAT-27225]|uniref:PAS domain S-box protein n=1 Tax=Bacillus sp. FJAT-27225 TaxID=1743144 RepID=UPI00080C2DD1|nr:PAS domain S-box protein [Bacillus sp. FJAT-27225]OCA88119.1 PAS domain-containing sensor histidine kinase [Bacillus sp. FJAT-27225]